MARVMRAANLSARRRRRFACTTDSDHDSPVYPNLAAGFVPSGPDQLWVADLTYIQLRKRFVYLAAILGAWSRKVVGYALATTMETTLTLAAIEADQLAACDLAALEVARDLVVVEVEHLVQHERRALQGRQPLQR
jgi:transposase InsO family protein